MLTMDDLNPLLRRRSTVITGEGGKVGTVGVVYLNDSDEQPTWVTVHTGLFGTRESFVPLRGASIRGRDLVIAYPGDLIRQAPSVDRDGHLSPEEEAALYRHYGLGVAADRRDSHSTVDAPLAEPAGRAVTTTSADQNGGGGAASVQINALVAPADPIDGGGAASAVRHDDADVAQPIHRDERPAAEDAASATGVHRNDDGGTPWVVRSEEKLRVGTEQYESGRVRLRKYVITEDAEVSVPLVTESVRIEVEPITSPTAREDAGTPFQEESVELVAREEVAVVLENEAVPVERVRMRRVEVAGRETVRAEVRKERIAVQVEGDAVQEASDQQRGSGKGRAFKQGRRADVQADAVSTTTVKGTNPLVKGKKKRR